MSPSPTADPSNQAFEVREKLASLEAALLAKTPDMPTLLRAIHKNLKADPDVVTLLSEEECSILVRGLKEVTKTTIAAKALKKGAKKALGKMTVDDL